MPKRTLASASSSPKKKAKAASNQCSLDKFFGASSNHDVGATPTPQHAGDSPTSFPARDTGEESLSADAEFAWKLAREDGLDLESLRKLENSGYHGGPVVGKQAARSEVIDVDLLDDQHNEAGPSTSSMTTAERIGHSFPRPQVRRSPASVRSPLSAARPVLGNATPLHPPSYRELVVDPPSYSPGLDDWASGTPVPYAFLANALASLAETRSRIAIVNILTNTLRTITVCHPPSLLPALYLLSNSLSPPYSPVELGLGPSVISKAIQHVSGLTPAALKRLYNRTGDPGSYLCLYLIYCEC